MINRVLVLLNSGDEAESLSGFVRTLKKRYEGVDVTCLYVRNTNEFMKYNAVAYNDTFYQDFMDVWKTIEEKKEKRIKEQFDQFFEGCSFLSRSGPFDVIVLEELRLYDLLILAKQEFISHELKMLLRAHHKPVLIVPPADSYGLERVMLAEDERLEANKALFSFMGLFQDVSLFHGVVVNIDRQNLRDLNVYMKKAGKEILYDFKQGSHVGDILLDASEEFDIMIMGDLKHSFLIERLGAKVGLKILEKMRIPLFIA